MGVRGQELLRVPGEESRKALLKGEARGSCGLSSGSWALAEAPRGRNQRLRGEIGGRTWSEPLRWRQREAQGFQGPMVGVALPGAGLALMLLSLFVGEPAFGSPSHPPSSWDSDLATSSRCVTSTRASPPLYSPLAAAPASSARLPCYFRWLQASCPSPPPCQ